MAFNFVSDFFNFLIRYLFRFFLFCSQQAEGSDSKAGAELLDMIFEKVINNFFTICRPYFVSLVRHFFILHIWILLNGFVLYKRVRFTVF
jgi:hypothetical protein